MPDILQYASAVPMCLELYSAIRDCKYAPHAVTTYFTILCLYARGEDNDCQVSTGPPSHGMFATGSCPHQYTCGQIEKGGHEHEVVGDKQLLDLTLAAN